MIAAGFLLGAFIGFLGGGVFMAAIRTGKVEDECRACHRQAVMRSCRLADGADELPTEGGEE